MRFSYFGKRRTFDKLWRFGNVTGYRGMWMVRVLGLLLPTPQPVGKG